MTGHDRRARQLPLDLATPAGLAREDLIVGPSNQAAVALIDRWPDWSAPVMVLAGPAGSGKSHMGTVWRESSGAIMLEAGRLGPEALEAASNGPVFIDDADEGALDEQGLFHLINTVRGADTHLLMTARRFPVSWRVELSDLASRLKAAAVVEIGEPDDALLAAIIAKLFADRQVEVEPHVIEYIVRRMERSLATANAVVDRLDRLALERKSRISRALAGEVINLMDAGQGALDL
jgi:chromosomal replication initiation ATPase DnaA